jgi:hypothetical protein
MAKESRGTVGGQGSRADGVAGQTRDRRRLDAASLDIAHHQQPASVGGSRLACSRWATWASRTNNRALSMATAARAANSSAKTLSTTAMGRSTRLVRTNAAQLAASGLEREYQSPAEPDAAKQFLVFRCASRGGQHGVINGRAEFRPPGAQHGADSPGRRQIGRIARQQGLGGAISLRRDEDHRLDHLAGDEVQRAAIGQSGYSQVGDDPQRGVQIERRAKPGAGFGQVGQLLAGGRPRPRRRVRIPGLSDQPDRRPAGPSSPTQGPRAGFSGRRRC